MNKFYLAISRRTRHVAISKEESTKEYVLNSREISATKLPNQAVQEVLIEVTESKSKKFNWSRASVALLFERFVEPLLCL